MSANKNLLSSFLDLEGTLLKSKPFIAKGQIDYTGVGGLSCEISFDPSVFAILLLVPPIGKSQVTGQFIITPTEQLMSFECIVDLIVLKTDAKFTLTTKNCSFSFSVLIARALQVKVSGASLGDFTDGKHLDFELELEITSDVLKFFSDKLGREYTKAFKCIGTGLEQLQKVFNQFFKIPLLRIHFLLILEC